MINRVFSGDVICGVLQGVLCGDLYDVLKDHHLQGQLLMFSTVSSRGGHLGCTSEVFSMVSSRIILYSVLQGILLGACTCTSEVFSMVYFRIVLYRSCRGVLRGVLQGRNLLCPPGSSMGWSPWCPQGTSSPGCPLEMSSTVSSKESSRMYSRGVRHDVLWDHPLQCLPGGRLECTSEVFSMVSFTIVLYTVSSTLPQKFRNFPSYKLRDAGYPYLSDGILFHHI
jgi:hypothetical protein